MLTDLITRLEAATGNERGLFMEAFAACFPEPPAGHRDPDWSSLYVRYTTLLDAQAWESAVRMLLPKGCAWWKVEKDAEDGSYWVRMQFARLATAHTEANAFAAACLKAEEQSNG